MVEDSGERRLPMSLKVSLTSFCAALYAIGAYATAYIPSPWGFGQFRPAVLIPAFFATVFGPWVGGVGAAIGTLICDSVKHGTLYMGSLLAAVPGNFAGFYVLGYMLRKRFTWGRFILASNLALAVGNAVVAFLYIFLYKVLFTQSLQMPFESLVAVSIGLTAYWFVTMLPFVLTITPILVRAAAAAFPGIVPESIRAHSLREELPRTTFALAFIAPGLAALLTGVAIGFTPFGSYLASQYPKVFTPKVLELLQLLFYLCGAALLILGFSFLGARSFLKPRSGQQSS
ncbi:MAG: ECF transporter S component [Thermofilum sp.]